MELTSYIAAGAVIGIFIIFVIYALANFMFLVFVFCAVAAVAFISYHLVNAFRPSYYFKYHASNPEGDLVEGWVKGKDQFHIHQILRDRGYKFITVSQVLTVKEYKNSTKKERL